ncbi:lantibiotic dehydratase C-terminal domain-containing protein [Actinomyces howellii]|uniref:Thiopeptide-type bacteriocin biosynthesis domain-containing protein n=1 Tax=Actinomyces howellii TaxID=52771 RepID=A0A3S4RF85_9ACTO|nr:lantibiotic dehydratase C-terminal domain-containing protein [Actinomyces howellii]VEG27712.1 Uncharacterised protein [Actinomyces howellii]
MSTLLSRQSPWYYINMYRWDADYSLLVTQVLVPLEAEFSLGTRWTCYFETDWYRGPHLTLALRNDGASERQPEVVSSAVKRYMKKLPASRPTNPHDYLDLHRKLYRYEDRRGHIFPWVHDGSITIGDIRRRVEHVGEGAASVIDQFYADMFVSELAILPAVNLKSHSLDQYSLDVLLQCALRFSNSGLSATAPSFMSHSQGYLAVQPNTTLAERWERNFSSFKDQLINYVDQVSRNNDPVPGTGDTPAVVLLLQEYFSHGSYFESFRPTGNWATEISQVSAFHEALTGNETWVEAVSDDDWFARYRMVLNLVYLHLAKMGLSPHRRFYLCYLLSRAVEELNGTDTLSYLEGVTE